MNKAITQFQVTKASEKYRGTAGESATAKQYKFVPAFRCEEDGRIEIARLAGGQPAPMHLIIALPQEWASRLNTQGRVLSLKEGITAGFYRNGKFYTREEAAKAA